MLSQFLDREAELAALEAAWTSSVSGSPRVIVIRGDSGLGKTRLVQEFYRRLVRDHDPEGYWPSMFTGDGGAISLEPAMEDNPHELERTLPWLWLALHLLPPGDHRVARQFVLEGVRRQIGLHLAGAYFAKRRRSMNLEVAKSTVSILSNFVFPGLGSGIEAGAQMLETLDKGISVTDAVRNFRARGRAQLRGAQSPIAAAAVQHRQSLLEGTIEALRALCVGRRGVAVPVVMAIDDAQWSDETTIGLLDELLELAAKNRWPLMVIMTATDDTLKVRASTLGTTSRASETATLRGLLDKLREEHAFDPRRPEPLLLALEPLATQHIVEILRNQLPTLTAEQELVIARKADGDVELLEEYATYLATSGWMDAGSFTGTLADLEGLTTVKKELVRQRFAELGGDLDRLLAWASAQGSRFYEQFVLTIAASMTPRVVDTESRLSRCDSPMHIIKLDAHPVLKRAGEFRRYVYYEISRERLSRLRERDLVLRLYAEALRTVVGDGTYERLDLPDQADITGDLLAVAEAVGLEATGDGWHTLLIDVRLRLAEATLLLGSFRAAADIAEHVMRAADAPSRAYERALSVIVEVAQIAGDTSAEVSGLERWSALPAKRGPLFYSRRAEYRTRIGAHSEAVEDCRTALILSRDGPRDQTVYLAAQHTYSLWFAGETPSAIEALRGVEEEFSEELLAQVALRVRVDHVACVVLHDFDLNDEVLKRSRFCVNVYDRLHRRSGWMRSLINLGDALWAIGHSDEALTVLREAYDVCVRHGGPHQVNIAAACLAHVLSHRGERDEAIDLYESALVTARGAGWVWDEVYADLYYTLVRCENGSGSPNELVELAWRARARGYIYLEATALAYAAMMAVVTSEPEPVLEECGRRLERTWVPLARAYLSAARIMSSEDESTLAREGRCLTTVLRGCHGMHGRPEFIVNACERIERAGVLDDCGALTGWSGAFR